MASAAKRRRVAQQTMVGKVRLWEKVEVEDGTMKLRKWMLGKL